MGRSSQTSQESTHERRLPDKTISAMSPISKMMVVVAMMAIIDQSSSTVSFQRLGAQKDNLISAVVGIKSNLARTKLGIARGIFGAKANIARGVLRPVAGIARAKLQFLRGLLDAKINKLGSF